MFGTAFPYRHTDTELLNHGVQIVVLEFFHVCEVHVDWKKGAFNHFLDVIAKVLDNNLYLFSTAPGEAMSF